MAAYISDIKPGEYSTNTAYQADLGKTTIINGREYRLCKSSASIAIAGGLPMATAYTLGVPTWAVAATGTLNDANIVGGVPIADTTFVGYIDSTVTIPISAYFLVQYYGPGKVTANTTISAGAAFGTLTTGFVASVDSAVYAPLAIKGRMTNTAVATAAGGVLTCIWDA